MARSVAQALVWTGLAVVVAVALWSSDGRGGPERNSASEPSRRAGAIWRLGEVAARDTIDAVLPSDRGWTRVRFRCRLDQLSGWPIGTEVVASRGQSRADREIGYVVGHGRAARDALVVVALPGEAARHCDVEVWASAMFSRRALRR